MNAVQPHGKLQVQLLALHDKMGDALKEVPSDELGKLLRTNSNNAGVARSRFYKITLKKAESMKPKSKGKKPIIAPESAAGRALSMTPKGLTPYEERFVALALLVGLVRARELVDQLANELHSVAK